MGIYILYGTDHGKQLRYIETIAKNPETKINYAIDPEKTIATIGNNLFSTPQLIYFLGCPEYVKDPKFIENMIHAAIKSKSIIIMCLDSLDKRSKGFKQFKQHFICTDIKMVLKTDSIKPTLLKALKNEDTAIIETIAKNLGLIKEYNNSEAISTLATIAKTPLFDTCMGFANDRAGSRENLLNVDETEGIAVLSILYSLYRNKQDIKHMRIILEILSDIKDGFIPAAVAVPSFIADCYN